MNDGKLTYLDPGALADIEVAAKYLLDCHIIRTLADKTILSAKIVEVEAYHENDPASHTYSGQTTRNRAMFGPPAHAYIYFTYGMHYCFNVTSGKTGEGAGVLIRAAEPIEGIEVMQQNRGQDNIRNLTSGPAKLAQAMAIDKQLYGHDLSQPPLQVLKAENVPEKDIIKTTRIGIRKAAEKPWRFYIKNNPYVSKI